MTLTFGSLFAGIGGFDLGFERAGMRCAWQVEIDPFCQQVLAKHWPEVERFGDVRECGKHNLPPVDVICGGFPCQPHSYAGKRRGEADDRDLWPEYRRIVAELRPRWVVAENVPGIRTTILDAVLSDLAGLEYETRTVIIPACALDAPHRRERVFIVAHAQGKRIKRINGDYRGAKGAGSNGYAKFNGSGETVTDTYGQRQQAGAKRNGTNDTQRLTRSDYEDGGQWATEPDVGRVAYGIPRRVDRLRALGNAVVPQVAQFVGSLIVAVEEGR